MSTIADGLRLFISWTHMDKYSGLVSYPIKASASCKAYVKTKTKQLTQIRHNVLML